MYTIKQAAARTGLTIPTIRAWERRYGVVSPERTEAGYRLYDEASIERLAAMRSLVELEGWRPSQAADRIRTPGIDLASLARRRRRREGLPAIGRSTRRRGHRILWRMPSLPRPSDWTSMGWSGSLTRPSRRSNSARHGRGCLPALRAVGRAWADGTLDVGAEHAASETVRRRLALFDAAHGPMVPTRLLVGMPPGGNHELGVFAFAVACRGPAWLSPTSVANVPLESWMQMVARRPVPVIVLGAVTREDALAGVDRVAAAIGNLEHPPVCFAGGPSASRHHRTSGAVQLPQSLDAAVGAVVADVTSSRRGPKHR